MVCLTALDSTDSLKASTQNKVMLLGTRMITSTSMLAVFIHADPKENIMLQYFICDKYRYLCETQLLSM